MRSNLTIPKKIKQKQIKHSDLCRPYAFTYYIFFILRRSCWQSCVSIMILRCCSPIVLIASILQDLTFYVLVVHKTSSFLLGYSCLLPASKFLIVFFYNVRTIIVIYLSYVYMYVFLGLLVRFYFDRCRFTLRVFMQAYSITYF